MSNAPPVQFCKKQGHRSHYNSHQGSNSYRTHGQNVRPVKSNRDCRMTLDPTKSILLSAPASPRPSSAKAKEHFPNRSLRESFNKSSHAKHSLESTDSVHATRYPQHISAAPQISFHPPSNLYNTYPFVPSFMHTDRNGLDPEDIAASARRKAFVIGITKPSARRGYLICRFCDAHIWGPNGK